MATIGRTNLMLAVRETPSGLYLDGGDLGEILLPGRLIPRGVRAGDKVEAFVHHDSEDRLVATTERPRAEVGGFAAMRVKDIHDRAGAFLDWGLSKDLLLPFREQSPKVRVGDTPVVAVTIDEDSGRVIASMRVSRFLDKNPHDLRDGDEVRLLVLEETPLGYAAIVDGRWRGLLYRTDLAGPLEIGLETRGFVRRVREDGKLDLALDEAGYGRVAPLGERIMEELAKAGGRLNYDDSSDPEAIRARFGASKKAFKQALGALYRARRIAFTSPGIEAVR